MEPETVTKLLVAGVWLLLVFMVGVAFLQSLEDWMEELENRKK